MNWIFWLGTVLLILIAVAGCDEAKSVNRAAVYGHRNGPADAETYLAEHSKPFCAFEGAWYDWEQDETITLG
jgi:hypothetical protein